MLNSDRTYTSSSVRHERTAFRTMAKAKADDKKKVGGGKDQGKGKGGGGDKDSKLKAANAINVRHILVSALLPLSTKYP